MFSVTHRDLSWSAHKFSLTGKPETSGFGNFLFAEQRAQNLRAQIRLSVLGLHIFTNILRRS
jgi:hypothetical protein